MQAIEFLLEAFKQHPGAVSSLILTAVLYYVNKERKRLIETKSELHEELEAYRQDQQRAVDVMEEMWDSISSGSERQGPRPIRREVPPAAKKEKTNN